MRVRMRMSRVVRGAWTQVGVRHRARIEDLGGVERERACPDVVRRCASKGTL